MEGCKNVNLGRCSLKSAHPQWRGAKMQKNHFSNSFCYTWWLISNKTSLLWRGAKIQKTYFSNIFCHVWFCDSNLWDYQEMLPAIDGLIFNTASLLLGDVGRLWGRHWSGSTDSSRGKSKQQPVKICLLGFTINVTFFYATLWSKERHYVMKNIYQLDSFLLISIIKV